MKMKPVGITSSTYIYFVKENDNKDHKLEVVDHVIISKYKNIFAKGFNTNWSEEDFMIKKVKNPVSWTNKPNRILS